MDLPDPPDAPFRFVWPRSPDRRGHSIFLMQKSIPMFGSALDACTPSGLVVLGPRCSPRSSDFFVATSHPSLCELGCHAVARELELLRNTVAGRQSVGVRSSTRVEIVGCADSTSRSSHPTRAGREWSQTCTPRMMLRAPADHRHPHRRAQHEWPYGKAVSAA